MDTSPPLKMSKSRLDSDYDSNEDEAKAAEIGETAPAQATKVPKKAKKTTSDSLIEQLVQTLTANQSHTQQILQERVELTDLVQGLGKTEVDAPKLKKLTKDSFIKFVELYDGYYQARGRERMVERIDPTSRGYAAKICKTDINSLLLMDNEEFRELMSKKFGVDNATGHKQTLQSLAMKKCELDGFSRDNVETYVDSFMRLITVNPALVDYKKKGATEKQANIWFIDGLQPDEFQTAVRAHDTKTIDDTNETLNDDITEFEGYMRIAQVTKAKGGKKGVPTPLKGSPTAPLDKKTHYDCGNCGSPDHDRKACPRRDECLQCKTKSHGYWSSACLLFIAWQQKKDRQRQQNGEYNKGGRFSAAYASPQQTSPSAIAPVCLQASASPAFGASETATMIQALQAQIDQLKAEKVKKKLLDSGANISIVSSLSHLDTNTFPTFLRADKPSVVETANNSTMDIQGRGQFEVIVYYPLVNIHEKKMLW